MERDTSYWKINLAMLWLSQLLVMAGFAAMIPFVPLFIKLQFHVETQAELALYITLFNVCGTVAYAIFNPIWGMLSDRFGVKPMLLRGTFVTAFLFPLMGYVHYAWLFVALRGLTAACAGTTAASQTMIARTTPDERQGFALGMLTTSFWGGSMLGNVAGGFIIDLYGYQAAFWFCGILYFLAGFAVLLTRDAATRRSSTAADGSRRSALSALSWSVSLMLLLFLAAGIVRYVEAPYVALKVEALTSAELAPRWTGIISAVVCVGAILSGGFIGVLADKLAPWKLLVPILLVSAAALAWQGASRSVVSFTAARTLLYLVAGGLQPVIQKVLTVVTPPADRGTAFGFSSCTLSLGAALAAVIGGWCFARFAVDGVFYAGALLFVASVPLFVHLVNCAVARSRAAVSRS